MTRPTSLIADLLVNLDEDLRYQFEERAGLMEFEGHQPRDLAEALALIDLLRSHPLALGGLRVMRVEVGGRSEYLVTTDTNLPWQHFERVPGARLTDVSNVRELVRGQFQGLALLRRLKSNAEK